MQSISLSTDKPLDPDKFFPFIQNLVQVEGPNILRCKGILSLQGRPAALRVPGRAHDARRRSPARMEATARSARAAWCSSAAICPRRRSARASRAAWRSGSTVPLRSRMSSERHDRHPVQIPSVADRTKPVAAGAPVVARALPRRRAPCSRSARRRCCSWRRTAPSSASRCMAAASSSVACDGARIVTGGDDGKVVATDANGTSETLGDRRQASLDRSRRARAGRRCRMVGRQAGVRAHRQGRGQIDRPAVERRRACLRAEGPAARGRALRRRDAVVSRTRRPRPRCSPGRARTSTSPSARTASSSSPACRSRRCTAGA